MKNKVRKTVLIGIIGVLVLAAGLMAVLLYKGILQCNNPSERKYPVRGVDVSSYQGEIDWTVLSKQDIQFAYIKATEGSSYVDPCFSRNYSDAKKTSLRIGAYHFFSFDSAGKTQAENFIANVPKSEDMLPPVVDVEFYADKEKNPPETADVINELCSFMEELEDYYGKTPVIYTTHKVYNRYIEGILDDFDIWIRSVYCHPYLMGYTDWTFWQYSNRMQLDGYKGEEKYIDMNVFSGTWEEFEAM